MKRFDWLKILLVWVSLLAMPLVFSQTIRISGNGIDIADNWDSHPNESDQSFGTHEINNSNVTKTFTIHNDDGANPLSISNIRIFGTTNATNASTNATSTTLFNNQYSITSGTFPMVIPAGGSVTFDVEYAPVAAGIHGNNFTSSNGRAFIRVNSDDAANTVFDFGIHGVGVENAAFDCSSGKMILANSTRSDWFELNYDQSPTSITTLTTGERYWVEAMGVNPNDNYIYGMASRYRNTNNTDNNNVRNRLIIIDADGQERFGGRIRDVATGTYLPNNHANHWTAGDFADDGYLYAKRFNNNLTGSFYRIDVNSLWATEIVLDQNVRLRDLIYDSASDLFYGVSDQSVQGLVSIDVDAATNTGTVTQINAATTHYHSIFRSSTGEVYGLDQNMILHQIDLSNGTTTQLTADGGTNLSWNDGASCGAIPLEADLEISKTDRRPSYIPDTYTTYYVTVKNNGPFGAYQATVADNIPAGITEMVWQATAYGNATVSNTSGNGSFSETVDIGVGDSVVFNVYVKIPSAFTGTLSNTATVTPPAHLTDPNLTNNTATDQSVLDLDDDNDGILNADEGMCESTITGSVNSRVGAWQYIGPVDAGRTYDLFSSASTQSFVAIGGPENGNVVNTVIYNTGTPNGGPAPKQVSLQRHRYRGNRRYTGTITSYDKTPHPWTGLNGSIAAERPPILGFMAFVDVNGNGAYDSGIDEYHRDLTTLVINPTVTGSLYMVFYDDGVYTDNAATIELTSSCRSLDTDGDGTPDYLDLDSDNDGCPDAREGGAGFAKTDLNADLTLAGGVDANGVPVAAGAAGQGIGTSIDNTTSPCCLELVLQVTNPPQTCPPGTVDITDRSLYMGSVDTSATGWSYWRDALATDTLATPNAIANSGTYYIVNENFACPDTVSVDVVINRIPRVISDTIFTVCAGSATADLEIGTSNGADQFTIDWDPTAEASGFTDQTTTPITPGDPIGYLFQEYPTIAYRVNLASGDTLTLHNFSENYNAWAYNEDDGYFWAVRLNSAGLGAVGIDIIDPTDWSVVNTLPLSNNQSVAGLYDPVNKWYVIRKFKNGTPPSDHNIIFYDGDPTSPTYMDQLRFFDGQSYGMPDIAFNAIDSLYYGIRVGTFNLIVINPYTNTETTLGTVSGLPNGTSGQYGAIYSTDDGKFYLSNNETGDIYLIDMAVDQFTATLFSGGPIATKNDGASPLESQLETIPINTSGTRDGGTFNGVITVENSTTGCTSSADVSITLNPLPTITLDPIASICEGTASTDITYTATTNNPDEYSIDWGTTAEAAGLVDVAQTTLPASPISITGLAAFAPNTYSGTITVYNSTTGCSSTENISFDINQNPSIDVLADQEVCDTLFLPAITGPNLTGNEAYFTGTGGTGIQLAPGDTIVSSTSLFIYDESGTTPNCSTEESFNIVVNTTPAVDDLTDATACDNYTLPTITGTDLTANVSYWDATGGTGTQYSEGDVITSSINLFIYDESGTTPNCFSEEQVSVTINTTPTVNDLADVTACDSYTLPTITGTDLTANVSYWDATGGTGTQYSAGDLITSSINLFIYDETGTSSNCFSEEQVSITINTTPVVNDLADVSSCDTYTLPTITGTNLTANVGYFTATNGGGVQVTDGSAITTTTTLFIYDESGTTPNCSTEEQVTITINDSPVINPLADQEECDTYTLPNITGTNLTGGAGYFTAGNGGGTPLAVGSAVTSSATIYVYGETGTTPNCFAADTFDVVINITPTVDPLANQEECGRYTLPTIAGSDLSGNQAYYTATNGGGTRYVAGDDITSSVAPLYIYDETATTPNCTAEQTFNVVINSSPIVDDLADATACDTYTLPAITGTGLSGNQSYYTATAKGGSAVAAGSTVSSTTTLFIYDETGTVPNCFTEEQVTITINTTPTVNDLVDQAACDSYTLPTINGSDLSGNQAYYTATNGGGTRYAIGDVINASVSPLYIYDETGTTPNCSAEQEVNITINTTPVVDDLADVTACDTYTLPTITGTNLTTNVAYYDGSNGAGTQVAAGTAITSNTTLFIYDQTGTSPNCSSEQEVNITINTTPVVNDLADVTECDTYILPVITGTDLTTGQSYYTATNGGGTAVAAGTAITTTTNLFIYDETGATPNCSTEEQVTITINSNPTIIASSGNPSSCGNADGTVTISGLAANTGYPDLIFDGVSQGAITSNGTGEYTVTGLNSGNYAPISVTQNGCSSNEVAISLIDPSAPSVNAGLPQEVCAGTAVTLTATNPDGAVITWDNSVNDGVAFTPTATTVYGVTATLAGCSSTDNVTITVNDIPVVDDLTDVTACDDYTLPTITGTDLTGNAAYFTATNGGGTRYAAGDVVNSSIAALYIYDETGTTPNCFSEETVAITINTTPKVNDLADVVECDTYTLPIINGSDLSGNQAYYTATNGGGTRYAVGDDVTATITPLFIYDETGTNPNCTAEQQVNITINITPVVNDLADVVQCDTYTLPNITGTSLSGNEGYFTAANGGGTQIAEGSTVTSSTTLFIYDQTSTTPNCTSEEIVSITINTTPVVDDLADQTHCDSYTLPVVSGLNLTGNQAYYTAPNGGGTRYVAGDVINSSVATLFIYDETATTPNCSSEETVAVTINTTPNIAVVASNPTVCNGNDGFVTISGLENSLAYSDLTFVTSQGGFTSTATGTHVVNNLASGAYTPIQVDNNGCLSNIESATLVDPFAPTVDAGMPQEICNGTAVTLTATNPDGAVITWDNGVTDALAFTPAIGTTSYTVTATLNGCSTTDQVEVAVIPNPVLNITDPADVCSPNTIDLTSSSVTTGSVNTGASWLYYTNASATIALTTPTSVSSSGTYYIVNENGVCNDTAAVMVVVNATPSLTITNPIAICEPNTVDITSSSITSGSSNTGTVWTYWRNASATNSLSAPTAIASSNTYYIVNESGSCSDTAAVSVVVNVTPSLTITDPAAVCAPNTIDITNTAVTAGSVNEGANTYYTNPLATVMYNSPTAATSGTYYMVSTGAGGCSDTASIQVVVNPTVIPSVSMDVDKSTICAGDNVTFTAIENSGGGVNPTFNWTINGNPAGSNTPIINSNSLVQGDLVELTMISDLICSVPATVTKSIAVTPYDPEVSIVSNGPVCEGEPITFQVDNTIDGGNVPKYDWYVNGAYVSSGISLIQEGLSEDDQIYAIMSPNLTCDVVPSVQSNNVEAEFEYCGSCELRIAEGVSPNGDGKNDFWKIEGLECYDFNEVLVFNRYGSLVYRSTGYVSDWDGYRNGRPMPVGTYYYVVKVRMIGEKAKEKAGPLTIIR